VASSPCRHSTAHSSFAFLDSTGYALEYFVSQTPELTQMADVVIDLGAFTKLNTASPAHTVA
jgi:hypothetical protein